MYRSEGSTCGAEWAGTGARQLANDAWGLDRQGMPDAARRAAPCTATKLFCSTLRRAPDSTPLHAPRPRPAFQPPLAPSSRGHGRVAIAVLLLLQRRPSRRHKPLHTGDHGGAGVAGGHQLGVQRPRVRMQDLQRRELALAGLRQQRAHQSSRQLSAVLIGQQAAAGAGCRVCGGGFLGGG